MADELKRWERLEAYLFDHHEVGSEFSVYDYVEETGLEMVPEGTADIQSYLGAQRSSRSNTLYVLQRVEGTRTASARWKVGERTKHARSIGVGLSDDLTRRVERAFVPDLKRMHEIEPRTKLTERQTDLIGHGVALLAAAAQGMTFEP